MRINRVFFFNIIYTCNNNCLGCVSKYTKLHSKRVIGLKDIVKIQDKFGFTGDDRFILSGGEPLQNSKFANIVSLLSLYSNHIVIYTNGRKE